MVVVTVTTLVTTLRLRKAAAWRSESSSGTLSSREVTLTKMLIGSSILFIVCLSPMSLFKYVMELASVFQLFWLGGGGGGGESRSASQAIEM